MENVAEVVEVDEDDEPMTIQAAVVSIFESFIPNNVVGAIANDQLLAVLITAVVVGFLLPPKSSILKAVTEIDKMVTIVITFLIQIAPIGVFFLIMPNLFKLNIAAIGYNLGILIGGTLTGIFIHLLVVLPLLFILMARANPVTYWLKCSPAWLTAWGSASSAATLPITLKCAKERGVPDTVAKFSVPLGCLINMDGYVTINITKDSPITNLT